MVYEGSSDLVTRIDSVTLASGQAAMAASLINRTVLVISADSVALFRSLDGIGDPLGNGLIRSAAIPLEHHLEGPEFILRCQAGFVGLVQGYALLIGLNDVRLFASAADALRNHNEIIRLSLAA